MPGIFQWEDSLGPRARGHLTSLGGTGSILMLTDHTVLRLDLECPPKAQCVEGLDPKAALLRGGALGKQLVLRALTSLVNRFTDV